MRSRSLVLSAMLAFALGVSAQVQTFTILHTFTGPPERANPYADLVQDAAGNLYGTTSIDGAYGFGTVFKLAPIAAPAFSLSGGTYGSAQTVTITDSVAGTVIYYTTDGSVPTTASTQYTGPITGPFSSRNTCGTSLGAGQSCVPRGRLVGN